MILGVGTRLSYPAWYLPEMKNMEARLGATVESLPGRHVDRDRDVSEHSLSQADRHSGKLNYPAMALQTQHSDSALPKFLFTGSRNK